MNQSEHSTNAQGGTGSPAESDWARVIRRAFERYDDTLLGEITTRLIKPRTTQSREELVQRSIDFFENPVQLDRRIQALEPSSAVLLEIAAKTRQNRWFVGTLAEMVLTLGWDEGIKPVLGLVEAGLAFPWFGPECDQLAFKPQFANLLHWLAQPGPSGHLLVFPEPLLLRAYGRESLLPDLSADPYAKQPGKSSEGEAGNQDEEDPVSEKSTFAPFPLPAFPGIASDGCEWYIRMAILWEKTLKNPLRRTQAGDYFKKDQERLEDPQIAGPIHDSGAELPDAGYWLAGAALGCGVFELVDTELRPAPFPGNWPASLVGAAAPVLKSCFEPNSWNPQDGWKPPPPGEPLANPFPSALALAWAFVARLGSDRWIQPAALERWILGHHPWWSGTGLRPSRKKPFLETWFLGLVWPLGLLEKGQDAGGQTVVRASATGRKFALGDDAPDESQRVPRMLIVQPNLEILAFRQGLDPQRIAKLSRFATWKTIGPACILHIGPDSVYRALELGESFETIRSFLDGHATRQVPLAVLDQLRTWASKRERVVVHTSALVLEFGHPADLEAALGRGLLAVRLGERHALVDQEEDIDFKIFRLAGSRDYLIPPEPCILQGPDGLELTVEDAKSDLLLETELPLVADIVGASPGKTGRSARITPASLQRVKERGWNLEQLEQWFRQRTGEPMRPTVRLFFLAKVQEPFSMETETVLYAPDAESAEGLWQWQKFRPFAKARIGPNAICLKPDGVDGAEKLLNEIGLKYRILKPGM